MGNEQIFEQLKNSVLNIDKEAASAAVADGLAAGIDPMDLIEKGFAAGMEAVGEEFEAGKRFLPQLMLSASLMTEEVENLKAQISGSSGLTEKVGRVVLGAVEGDVHDIGKNIVKIFLNANGFEVYDLGRDVLLSTFIDKAEEVNADIIATSALMTSTMQGQATLEEMLAEKNLKGKIKTMIGGAPCTEHWAEKIGADAYAESAADALEKALNIMCK
ncbi:corrinoid protein [Methanococcoides sp. FTZ1]|uniref:corrinoid protein n=1 Tax=Methanococcoides sp. FTZ1 TaxID=3439061 RepID=UPI003F83D1F6